jgi:hypothetical protein
MPTSVAGHAPRVRPCALALMALLAAASAAAGPARTPAAPPQAASVIEGEPGDPALAPDTARQLEREAAVSRSTRGLALVRRPDGSGYVNLQGRFRAWSVITIAPDGTVHRSCFDHAGHAAAHVRAASAVEAGVAFRSVAPRCGLGPRED